jgi:hypothetical protein
MKNKFFQYLGMLLLGSSLVFTSCTKDEETDTFAPSIMLSTEAGFVSADTSVNINGTFKVKIIASKGSGNLSEVAVFKDNVLLAPSRIKFEGNDAVTNPTSVGTFDASALNWEIEVTVDDHEAVHSYRFQVQAADGLTNSVALNITTVDPGTPVDMQMGVLFNQAGPAGTGGLDLDTGIGTGSADTNAEIRDMGIDLGQPPATNWRQQIAPVNMSELRAAPAGTTWDEIATKESIQAGFNASGANINMTSKLQGGELFFVRRDNKYYFIRIAKVNVTTDNNNDNYEIDIKR